MKRIILLLLLCIGSIGFSQNLLTLEEAIKETLEHNFAIRIAKNEFKIDSLNATAGNAGMLPRVNAAVINNNTIQNATLTQITGAEIEIEGARNLNINYGIGLEWTIFDGFSMFARNKQLKEFKNLGENEMRLAVLTKVSEVYSTYYQLVNLQKLMGYTDSIINISNFRVNTAQNRFTIGKASKLEVLNAEVDRNADLSTQVRLKEQWGITKIRLLQLMGKTSPTNFKVQDEIETDKELLFADLMSLAEQQNPQLQMQYIQQKIQEYELKQIKGNRFPVVSVNTGYNLVRSLSPFGFITESTGRNFVYGFTASLNIFDGFNQNRMVKTTSIQLENTKLQIEEQKLAIQSQIATLFQTYQTQLELAQLEHNNERIAEQNLDITLEKYKIGTLTPVEFRTAQLNYINAVIRWQNALLEAKISEIALKELAGNLSF